jgi:hypothetical protein
MSLPDKDPNIIVLRGRLSYPTLNVKQLVDQKKRIKKKPGDEGGSDNKYGCSILLDKETAAEQIKAVRSIISRIAGEQWKGKVVTVKGQSEKVVDQPSPKAERVVLLGTCLHDGEEKADKDGYGDHVMYVSSSRKESDGPPRVIGKDKNDIHPEESHYPYAGCYVVASIRLWAQDNDYGKRVNADLRVVIFDKHGEPFGKGTVDVDSDFAGVDLDDESESAPEPAAKPAAKKPAADLSIDDM